MIGMTSSMESLDEMNSIREWGLLTLLLRVSSAVCPRWMFPTHMIKLLWECSRFYAITSRMAKLSTTEVATLSFLFSFPRGWNSWMLESTRALMKPILIYLWHAATEEECYFLGGCSIAGLLAGFAADAFDMHLPLTGFLAEGTLYTFTLSFLVEAPCLGDILFGQNL